jgi:hypothetical protein
MRNPWTGRATDHSGATVDVVQTSQLPPHTPKPVIQAVKTAHSGTWRYGLTTAAIAAGVIFAIDVFQSYFFGGLNFFSCGIAWHIVVVGIGAIIAIRLVGRVEAQHNSKRAIARCLDAGLCPSCAYSLDSIPLDGQARRTCPECGSIWKAGTHSPPPVAPGPRQSLKSQLDQTRARRTNPPKEKDS